MSFGRFYLQGKQMVTPIILPEKLSDLSDVICGSFSALDHAFVSTGFKITATPALILPFKLLLFSVPFCMIVCPLIVVIKLLSFHVSCTQNPAIFLWIMVSTNFSNFSSPPNPFTFWDNNLHSNGPVSLGLVLIFLRTACPTRTVSKFWIIVELAAPFSKSLKFSRSFSSVHAVGGGWQGANLGVCVRYRR